MPQNCRKALYNQTKAFPILWFQSLPDSLCESAPEVSLEWAGQRAALFVCRHRYAYLFSPCIIYFLRLQYSYELRISELRISELRMSKLPIRKQPLIRNSEI